MCRLGILFNFLEEDRIEFGNNINWHSPSKSGAVKIANTLSLKQIQKLRQVFDDDKIDVFCVESNKDMSERN